MLLVSQSRSKVESKKKYKRKKKVTGYYYDYDGKEQILYDDN
jgi:hypothetical protein